MAPPANRTDDWREVCRACIRAARELRELRQIETWAKILSLEAHAARIALAAEPPPNGADRNIRPSLAADRLGITVRKLTRERFTTYREICIPIEGQSRGYVVSERALVVYLLRQRDRA